MQAGDVPQPAAAPVGPPLDAYGAIADDIHCRQCGYNLRGLTEAHRCPECGAAVGLSTRGNLLRFAEPGWVERIARGGRLLMGGLTAVVLGMFVFTCAGMLTAALMTTATDPWLLAVPLAAGAWMLAAFAAVGYGVWLITARDPADTAPALWRSPRLLARLGIIAAMLVVALDTIGDVMVTTLMPQAIIAIATLAMALATFIGALAYLRYGGTLADRIPEPKLVARARNLFRSAIMLFVVVLVPFVLAAIATAGMLPPVAAGGPPAALGSAAPGSAIAPVSATAAPPVAAGRGPGLLTTALPVSACAAMVFSLVLFLVFVRWQSRLGKALREQAAIARATSAASPTGTAPPPLS